MSRKLLAAAALAALLTTYSAPARAVSDGPSALMAAQLAMDPQAGWIGHYLPDDRYKIVGGIWKVVSTETDPYYHVPQCPKMLAQSADNVIGFASAKDAEDAGYLPDPSCGPNDDGDGGGFGPGSSGPHKARLSDGVSTIVVPAGFVKQGGFSSSSLNLPNNKFKFALDMFHGSGQQELVTMSMDMSQFPGMSQVDLSRSFTPEGFSRMRDQSNQLYLQLTGSSSDTTNAFMAGFSHALKLMTGFSSASIGRFSGVLAHTNAIGTGQPIALVIAGSGARIYNVEGLGVDDATIKAVARTFTTH